MLARPRFYASVTCAFVAKNRVVLEGFRFLPALPYLTPCHTLITSQSAAKSRMPCLMLARVNELLGVGTSSVSSVDIDALARAVIRGVYGKGVFL